MSEKINTESLYKTTCESVDKALEAFNGASTEGLNSNIFGKALVAIVDTFIGVTTTIGSNIFRVTKSIKRSELHEFMNSNVVKLRVIDNIPYSKLVGFKVDVPANLNDTYAKAIALVANMYVKMNALNNIQLMRTAVTEIFTSITNNNGKTGELINKYSKLLVSTAEISVRPTSLELINMFSGKFEKQLPFDKVFLSKEEWSSGMDDLVDLEPRLREASGIKDIVKSIENILKNICVYAKDNQINQQDLIAFGNFIKASSLIMDSYQMTVTRQLSLEHNYVLMANSIYSKVK